jgi:hypothetical protein
MLRVRRLVTILLAMALGTLSLTGCRSNPAAAVYIGDKQYSNAYVEHLNSEILDVINSQSQEPQQVSYAQSRRLIVSLLVIREVGPRIAAERGITLPKADPAITASELFGVSEDSPEGQEIVSKDMARVFAEAFMALGALSQVAGAVEPAEADQRAIYDILEADGQAPGISFEEIQPYLTKQTIGSALGLRNVLTAGFEDVHITVNPRYAPLTYQIPVAIGQGQIFVPTPISTR